MNKTAKVVINEQIVWTVAEDMSVYTIQTLAKKNHWSIHIMGRAAMPEGKVKINNFIYEPLVLSESTTPPVALNRANEILKHIAAPQGFLIGKPIEKPKPLLPKVEVDWRKVQETTEDVLTLIGTVVGTAATVGFGLMLASLALIDPSVVIVTQDGTFIEIYRDYV